MKLMNMGSDVEVRLAGSASGTEVTVRSCEIFDFPNVDAETLIERDPSRWKKVTEKE